MPIVAHRFSSTHRSARSCASAALLCAGMFAGCSLPAPQAIEPAALVRAVELRADDSSALREAFASALSTPLPFELPPLQALTDPADPRHLRAHVLVHAPAVREARHMWLAAAEADVWAAAVAPLELGAEFEDPPDSKREWEFALTFELLGLFGAGRAGAERAIATAEQRRALASLWEAAWSALHEAERARVRTLTSRERIAALRGLVEAADLDRRRIEILAEQGYARPDQVAWAAGVRAEIEDRLVHERIELARSEAEFASAVGWTIGHAREWIANRGLVQRAIEAPQTLASDPADMRALLDAHPALLGERLEYALAEARVQAAAREYLPALRVGPRLKDTGADPFGGGLLSFELGWPPAVRARIRVLEHEREGARERLEDRLLSMHNQLVASAERLRLERDEALPRARTVDAGAAAMWTTARERFANATDVLEEWSFALEHRVDPLLELIDVREHVELAALDCSEQLGSTDVAGQWLALTGREQGE